MSENKIIKSRFPEELIGRLKEIDFTRINLSMGDVYEQWCTTELSPHNSERIIRAFAKNE